MTGHDHNHAIALDAVFLVSAVAALLAGPLLRGAARRESWLSAVIDTFLPVAVVGAVLVGVLPDAIASIGALALAAAAFGFVVPAFLERLARRTQRRGQAALLLVVITLVPHFLLDGFALLTHDHAHHGALAEQWPAIALAFSVVLHQLPFGLFLFAFAHQTGGRRTGWAVIGFMALVIVVGFVLAEQVAGFASGYAASAIESFVAGTIAHVVLIHGTFSADSTSPRQAGWRLVGLLAGAALVLLSPSHSHGAEHAHHMPAFGRFVGELAPASLIAIVGASIAARFATSSRAAAAVAAGLAALPLATLAGGSAALAAAAVLAVATYATAPTPRVDHPATVAGAAIVGLAVGYVTLAGDSTALTIVLIVGAAILAGHPLAPLLVAASSGHSDSVALLAAIGVLAALTVPAALAAQSRGGAAERVGVGMMIGVAAALVTSAAVARLAGAPIATSTIWAVPATAVLAIAACAIIAKAGWPGLKLGIAGDTGTLPHLDGCALPPSPSVSAQR